MWYRRGFCCVYVSSERFYLTTEVLQPQETGKLPAFEVVVGMRKFPPLAVHVSKAAKKYVNSHRAPLHELLHAYKIDPSKFKDIRPIRTGPKWIPRYTT